MRAAKYPEILGLWLGYITFLVVDSTESTLRVEALPSCCVARSVPIHVAKYVDQRLLDGSPADPEVDDALLKALDAKVARIVALKSFPAAAQRLAHLSRCSDPDTQEVLSVLENDRPLARKLLRLVNTSGFTSHTRCHTLQHALTLLGTRNLSQIATTAAVMELYSEVRPGLEDLFEHASLVGSLTRFLAFYLNLPAEDLFTAGFLHDFGKLMFWDTEGEAYGELLTQAKHAPDALSGLERERFGFDHAVLAGQVLTQWGIPDPVPKLVAWHHHLALAFADSHQLGTMVSVLRLGDLLSYALTESNSTAQARQLSKLGEAKHLGLNQLQLEAIWPELEAVREQVVSTFRDSDLPLGSGSDQPAVAGVRVLAEIRSLRASLRPSSVPPALQRPALSTHSEAVVQPPAGLPAEVRLGIVGVLATLAVAVLGALIASGPLRSSAIISAEIGLLACLGWLSWLARGYVKTLLKADAAAPASGAPGTASQWLRQRSPPAPIIVDPALGLTANDNQASSKTDSLLRSRCNIIPLAPPAPRLGSMLTAGPPSYAPMARAETAMTREPLTPPAEGTPASGPARSLNESSDADGFAEPLAPVPFHTPAHPTMADDPARLVPRNWDPLSRRQTMKFGSSPSLTAYTSSAVQVSPPASPGPLVLGSVAAADPAEGSPLSAPPAADAVPQVAAPAPETAAQDWDELVSGGDDSGGW